MPTDRSLDPCRRLTTYHEDELRRTRSASNTRSTTTRSRTSAFDHGYRSGGLQLRANSATEVPDVRSRNCRRLRNRPENYDGSWLHDAARSMSSAFYSDYQDIQRTISYIPIGQTILSTAVLNAAAATIKGGELELTFSTNRQRYRPSYAAFRNSVPQARARSRHISAMRARSMTRWPMSSARTPFAASAPDSYRRFMPSAITAMRQ